MYWLGPSSKVSATVRPAEAARYTIEVVPPGAEAAGGGAGAVLPGGSGVGVGAGAAEVLPLADGAALVMAGDAAGGAAADEDMADGVAAAEPDAPGAAGPAAWGSAGLQPASRTGASSTARPYPRAWTRGDRGLGIRMATAPDVVLAASGSAGSHRYDVCRRGAVPRGAYGDDPWGGRGGSG
ncbi:hypothetical protein GCM10010430_26270 [Kitasatospora cystarginea]|uniref:Uncharacterized protein n=1 Tax=Kitasatospora cystarginea TaxID=58350 RepID=A0ABP5QSN9_9ACTN